MKKILAGVLVALSLIFGGCQTTESTLAPIPIRNSETDIVGTKISTATEIPPIPTVQAETTPTVAQNVSDQIGKAAPQHPTPTPAPEVNPWEKEDWGWVRATWAAQGKHDFLTGTIGTCQKLALVLNTCFFTMDEQEKRPVEFGYDGKRTYFLAYEVGDTHSDSRELGVERRIWHVINGDLLFPLCGSGKVEVYKFDPVTGSKSTWC